MMLHGLGAALAALGCTALGLQMAGRLRARVRALEEVGQGLLLLEQELELNQTPLPQLMAGLEVRTSGSARALYGACRQVLDRLEQTPFSEGWRQVLEQLPVLGEEGRRVLAPLGDTLGRYESPAQVRAVAAARARLAELEQHCRQEAGRLGRVYSMMGLSGGAFLVILLL